MRDKRPVDELSIEELERILAIRKRDARQARLGNYQKSGRRLGNGTPDEVAETPVVVKPAPAKEPSPAVKAAPPKPAPAPVIEDQGIPQFEDEVGNAPRGGSARLRDRVLLGVEIAATLGIFFLLFNLVQTLQQVTQSSANINQQAQQTAMAQMVTPTATPILNISSVVLPSGHTVTLDSQGNVVSEAFNLDEVPAQYQADFKQINNAPFTPPTESSEGPSEIKIPKINVDSTVVSGDNWQALQLGVGHHLGSANPGERGNMVLSAHDDVFGETFRYLDKLDVGDDIHVFTLSKEYIYRVQKKQFVYPSDTWVLDPQGDSKLLTLISCYPYQKDTQRIIIFATLENS